ncbi:flagellar biosynthetic protein FliR [Paracoccus onubensis]|uniref:flagellar biosynthetic protein FliR n=1 Tax=Paracoccus onubensis TaxID=1675788 RepID=UPI0027303922|nr:flagellar biosynthetic protein FliR [Paracoccus onubensis]MDP0925759.1 flagellar biosynthetic protein FliR [Paracoccus onubensis]
MWQQAVELLPGFSWTMVLVYARVQACLLILPGFGEQVIPARVKVGLAMVIVPLLTSGLPVAGIPRAPVEILGQIAVEMVIGLASGGLLRILAIAIDIAATAIATASSLSQLVGISLDAAPHPLGNLLHLGGMAVLLALGLPVMVLQFMADGLSIWPPGGWPDLRDLAYEAIPTVARAFGLAMLLAAPFTLGGFLFQALSGVINRVMPSLPVIFIGSPLSVFLAIAGAAMMAPLLIEIWANAVLDFTLSPL